MVTRVFLASLKAITGLVSTMVAEKVIQVPWWADALIVMASVYVIPNVGYVRHGFNRNASVD